MYYGDYSKYITRLYQLVLNEGFPIPGALLDLPNDIISLFERACDIDDLFYMLRIMEISGANIGTDFGKSLPIARDGYLRAKLRLKAYYDFLGMSDELGLLFPIPAPVGSESDSGEIDEDGEIGGDASSEVVENGGNDGFVDLDSYEDSDEESWGDSDIDSEAVDNYFASMIKLRAAKEKRSVAREIDIFKEFIPDSSGVDGDPVDATGDNWFNDIDDVESQPEDGRSGKVGGNWFSDLDNEPTEVSKSSDYGIRVFQRSKFAEEEDYSDSGEWVTDIDDIDYSPRKTSKATDLDDDYPFEVVEGDGYREENDGEDEEYPFEIVEDDGYREESEESEDDYPFEIVEDDGYRDEESEEDEEYPFEIVEDDGYREEGSESGEDSENEDFPFEIVEDDGYRDSEEGSEEDDYPFEIVADDGYREEGGSLDGQHGGVNHKTEVPRKPVKGDKDIADAVQDSVNKAVTDVVKGIKKVLKK